MCVEAYCWAVHRVAVLSLKQRVPPLRFLSPLGMRSYGRDDNPQRPALVKVLRQRVLPPLDHLLRDLLPQLNRVEWLMLGQPAQNRQLGAQHVTVGYGGDYFLSRGFNLLHRLREIDTSHGNGKGSGAFALVFRDLLCTQHSGFHSVSLDDYVCVAAPATNKPSFLADDTSLRSSASGPSSSSPTEGPDKTSSINFLIAGMRANWPDMARFSRKPVMMSRLISLVPSKMRLMRASR